MKKLLKRMIALIMLMAICVTSIYTSAYAQTSWDGVTKSRVYEEDGFKVTMSLSSYWNGGYNADIKIENTSDTAKENWYLGFEYDDVITNIWNAEIVTNESGYYVIRNATWNQDIAPKSYVQFGFSSNEDFDVFPDEINILGTSVELSSDDYTIDYKLDSDWGTGFVSVMTITNISEDTIEDWVIEFNYDREITNIWNGTIESHEGNHYVIKNAGYNANISAGQSITFGFNGCDGTETDVPYDCKLVAYKVIDSDGDGISDYVEDALEMNKYSDDTDDDGLSDYEEIYYTATDPVLVDTDSDGICDGDDDTDEDGLDNFMELQMGTDATKSDSDNDGLTDYEEIYLYFTEAIIFDTDGDVVSDGMEIQLGTDPLVRNDKFMLHKEADDIDSVKVSVDIELTGKQVYSLSVEKSQEDFLFPDTMPGYIGGVYEFMVDGTFEEATLNFEFDNTLLSDSSFEPVIYYYNESEQELEELETVVEGNVAKAKTTHFSKYILLNRTVYEEAFEWQDVWVVDDGVESSGYSSAEIVLVIDDSGSMVWNDANNQRLSVAQELVGKLPLNSKVGVVKFEYSTWILSATLLTDRNEINNLLTTNYFNATGGTYMYKAINSAFALFGDDEEGKLKMMIVLSDGASEDTNRHNSIITTARNRGIKIYTVGLGTSTSYFNNYLQPLASNTGGEFYFAEDASQLAGIYENITNKVDIETDSDGDGITDYYEDNLLMFNGVPLLLDKNDSDTDNDGVSDGEEVVELKYEYNEDRTKVIVTGKINSNPAEKDSDYDGVDDGEELAKEERLDNKYTATMHYYVTETLLQSKRNEESHYYTDVSFRMDYRNFFYDNTTYSEELAVLGSLLVNDMYSSGHLEFIGDNKILGSTDKKDNDPDGGQGVYFQEILGLKNVRNYDKDEILDASYNKNQDPDDVTEFTIGHKKISYIGKEMEIVFITLRGTNGTSEEWSSNFDVGADTYEYFERTGKHDDWSNKENHKGFDVAATRVLNVYNDYLSEMIENGEFDDSAQKCIFIVGHSRAAAISNILGTYFEDDKEYKSFVYTYATPYTTTSSKSEEYHTIFNIVNTDDIVTYLPLQKWEFKRYGVLKDISVKDEYEDGGLETQIDTFEYLFGEDYDSNGQLDKTINAFKSIDVKDRDDLYRLDYSSDGTVYVTNDWHFYYEDAYEELEQLEKEFKSEKLLRFCELDIDVTFIGCYVSCNYCPAFLLQTLANMTASPSDSSPELGRDMKGTYVTVKRSFVFTSGRIYFGGMANPHMPPTYYLIAKNNFKSIK